MTPFPLILLLCILSVIQAWAPTDQGQSSRLITKLRMAASGCWADEQGKELVERFGSFWEDEAEKVYALESLMVSQSQDRILDGALLSIADVESSALGKRRWSIRFPSRRATMGCYGRILAEMNSGRLSITENWANDSNNNMLDEKDQEVKQRRNLVLLLEVLSTHPKGVWSLEREMIQDAGVENFGFGYGQNK